MFIELLLTTTRAPAERNVSANEWDIEHVSLLWSDEEFIGGRTLYKHFVPTGRGSCAGNYVRKTRSDELATQTGHILHTAVYLLALARLRQSLFSLY